MANYYGATSSEATLAKDFFAAHYGDTSATMLFTRLGIEQRPHLLGANLSNLTLTQLQSINGSVALTFDGYTYSAYVNLSGVTSFLDAAGKLRAALNHNLQVAAVTAGSSITPESTVFTGYTDRSHLFVTSVSSGIIEIGGLISGKGLKPGAQIISQASGTPGGAGEYILFNDPGTEPTPETIKETYGVLTVGAVNSGTVALGQEVTGAGVLPLTAIDTNLSGSGPGSKWVVNNAQTVAGDITMTAPPLTVFLDWDNQPIIGATENNDFFDVSPNGSFGFDFNPSDLSYMSGTAAAALGLTQASGAIDSSPGGQHPTMAQFLTNIVQNETNQFGSFQSNIPRSSQAMAAWAQSTGLYQFLTTNFTTRTAGSSAPTIDPAGTYSGPGASAPTPAAPGTYLPVTGATSAAAEILDLPGTYSLAGASAPTLPSPDFTSRRPARASRRRFLLAITNRTWAQRRSFWRCRQPYRVRWRGSLLRLGSLTRRFLLSRSTIQTSILQTAFRSSSRAAAANWPTVQASADSRKARPAFTSFRGPQPRSPANSTHLFLLRTRSPRHRRLL